MGTTFSLFSPSANLRTPGPPVIYSSACEYAIRTASYLAARSDEDGGELVKLRDIAEAEELPPSSTDITSGR